MISTQTWFQFSIGLAFGAVIACSPTKFNPGTPINSICDASVTNCVTTNGYVDITQNFNVGAGKVDILFVNDNSASMSTIQNLLANRFAGFIQNLDNQHIDYRIAITTTDLNSVSQGGLITFGNGNKYLTNADASRVSLFNSAIARPETVNCENLITSSFNTYGVGFQSTSNYINSYPTTCPSSDTRGIYTANTVVSGNASSFIRSDANLNIILISNDDVRQGKYISNSALLETNDRATTFTSMMQSQYPNKYWDFNSIIVKDNTCKVAQTLRNAQNVVVSNQFGPAIAGGIGLEYANLSNSAAVDIDNNPRPRGQILDICLSDYASHFTSVSTQISNESRMFNMRCTPVATPIVTVTANPTVSVPFTWNGGTGLTFQPSSAGTPVTVSYRCYTGPT